ncbi:DUF2953 domain-containing protein [Haloimpatiens sp. FM7330]|uniref:DUF2953 domain-containing protein n=1 Tax=Haloimpatiens sp. FM7330 TaxID=3298610 RepID=UPI00363318B4
MFLFFAAIVIIFLLFPIPIKIQLKFMDNKFELYFYNKKIDLKKTKDTDSKKKKKKRSKLKYFQTKKLTKDILINIYNILEFNPLFKPSLKFKYYLSIGTDDAAKTALLFGLINTMPAYIYKFLSNFFKVKKYKYHINPNFNKKEINIQISSIIFANIVKVIYMIFKILSISKKYKNKPTNSNNFKMKEEY